MGKIIHKIDREEVSKPSRKRRKKELDRIHSKILKAKRKLDNVEKGNYKDRQNKQSRAKICNRLLPKLDAGIYRNGTKSKDIRKAETSENIFNKARLNADALKLFNGDTPESRCIEISSDDETAEKFPNKGFVKHNVEWTLDTLEQSPILAKGQCQNQNVCVKKKGKDNTFQKLDPNKIRKQIDDELICAVQKDVCKRRLFQNDKEQLTDKVEAIATRSQVCDNIDQTKDDRVNEKNIEQSCSNNSENNCDPLTRYMEFCKIISAENFESNFIQNYQPDLVAKAKQKLRHIYADTFCLQLSREKDKQGLINVESPVFVEYQACTTLNASDFSPVEFEVPKCIENHTITTRLQSVSKKNNNSHFIRNAEFQKSSDITHCSSTSYSTQNTSAACDTNSFSVKNHENNNNQYAKQSGIHQLPRPASFCLVNEKNPIIDSQRTSKHNSHSSKNNCNKNNFYVDIRDHNRTQCTNNAQYLKNLIFTSDAVLAAKGHSSKDYCHEKLSTDNPSKDILPKYDDKINMKNVKQVPTILRRYNIINNHSKINDDCIKEDVCKKSTINLFNKTPDQDINKEFYETEFPNIFQNLATPSEGNDLVRDRSKLPESQSELMEIKNARESQVDEFDINVRSNELNRKNGFFRFDKPLHSQAFETSYDTNTHPENILRQQDQIASNTRNHIHSNYRPINHLQHAKRFLDIDTESAKRMQQTVQQAKLHTREASNAGARDQNKNIFFSNVSDGTIPTAALSFSPNIRTDTKSRESTREETFHVKCMKNQTNTCCNEQYVYFDSTHCPRKHHNMSQAQHSYENTEQSEASYNMKSYNNDTNNCINRSNGVRNVSLLPVERKHSPCMYLKVSDNQRRAMLLQNVTQPVKYLAVKNDSGIQRIPVYINDESVKVAENVPLRVVALVDSNTQSKAFSQEVPLQTNNLQFDNFATQKTSNQFVVKHLNPVNTILLNPDSQSSIWYASNL